MKQDKTVETTIPPLVKSVGDLGSGIKPREILLPALIILVIIVAGGLTGFWLSRQTTFGVSGSGGSRTLMGGAQLVQSPKEMGIKDTETFRDSAKGRIEVNDNPEVPEGSHKLIRSGGPSQTAYITSSVVDLNLFVGKCVEVNGQTFAAKKAAWLMDIGWVKLLDSCPEGL